MWLSYFPFFMFRIVFIFFNENWGAKFECGCDQWWCLLVIKMILSTLKLGQLSFQFWKPFNNSQHSLSYNTICRWWWRLHQIAKKSKFPSGLLKIFQNCKVMNLIILWALNLPFQSFWIQSCSPWKKLLNIILPALIKVDLTPWEVVLMF